MSLGGEDEELVEARWGDAGLAVCMRSAGSGAVQLCDKAGEFAIVGGHGYSMA